MAKHANAKRALIFLRYYAALSIKQMIRRTPKS